MDDIKLPPLPKPDRLMENDDYLICGYTQDQMENYARAAMAATPAPHDVPAAMRAVIAAMKADPEYAWSWHCNVAMAFVDAGGDHYTANQGAARFMRALAGVEPAHELPALAATPAADELTGCNCRWKGDEQLQWCELHAAHREAIHDWAERAKTAEEKLVATPAPAPEGRQSVPAEPTTEMVCRGQQAALESAGRADWCANVYRAMLSAAPAATPAPAPAASEVVSLRTLSGLFEPMEGYDKHQPGYDWRKGWNDALRRAMDYATPASAPPAATPATLPGYQSDSNQTLWQWQKPLVVALPGPHPDTPDAERYRKLVASGKYTAASIGGGWGLSCGGARWTKAELDAAADALPAPRAQAQKGE